MIFAPGSSLGGAQPKANVCDTDGSLWIAKFPSRNDGRDMAAWEMLAYTLATRCGVHMSDSNGQGLKLDIDESDNSLDFQLAMEVAPYFRLKKAEAAGLLNHVRSAVATWPSVASGLGISRQEQDDMAPAFHL